MSWDKQILKQGKVSKVVFISLLSYQFQPKSNDFFFVCFFLDSTIDYLAQYRLVDRSRLEMYGRAFTLEDDDEDGIISYEVFQFYVYIRRDNKSEAISKKELWSIVLRSYFIVPWLQTVKDARLSVRDTSRVVLNPSLMSFVEHKFNCWTKSNVYKESRWPAISQESFIFWAPPHQTRPRRVISLARVLARETQTWTVRKLESRRLTYEKQFGIFFCFHSKCCLP